MPDFFVVAKSGYGGPFPGNIQRLQTFFKNYVFQHCTILLDDIALAKSVNNATMLLVPNKTAPKK